MSSVIVSTCSTETYKTWDVEGTWRPVHGSSAVYFPSCVVVVRTVDASNLWQLLIQQYFISQGSAVWSSGSLSWTSFCKVATHSQFPCACAGDHADYHVSSCFIHPVPWSITIIHVPNSRKKSSQLWCQSAISSGIGTIMGPTGSMTMALCESWVRFLGQSNLLKWLMAKIHVNPWQIFRVCL